MIISKFEEYIAQNIHNSILIKTFAFYLFSGYVEINSDDLEILVKGKTDYKNIAAQGYIITRNNNSELEDGFLEGLVRLQGREWDIHSSFVLDDIALLGVWVGLVHIQRIDEYKKWLFDILAIKAKKNSHKEAVHFFRQLIEQNPDNTIPEKMSLYLFEKIINGKIEDDIARDYFTKYRKQSFPYFAETDVFLNLITIYNVDWVIKNLIPTQDDLNKRVNERVQAELTKVVDQYSSRLGKIKNKLFKAAKRKSKILFGTAVVSQGVALSFLGKWIWNGDWDWFEPKTYLFGLFIPFLFYTTNVFCYLISGKSISLNPKKMLTDLTHWHQKRLYKKYDFNLEEWQHLQNLTSSGLSQVEIPQEANSVEAERIMLDNRTQGQIN